MKSRFAIKILFLSLFPVFLLSVILPMVFVYRERGILEREFNKRGASLARNLSASVKLGVFAYDTALVKPPLEEVCEEEDVAYVAVYDTGGNVFYAIGANPHWGEAPPSSTVRDFVSPVEIYIGEFGRERRKEVLGYVRVGLDSGHLFQEIAKSVKAGALLGVFFFLVGFVTLFSLTSRISRDFCTLIQGAKQMGAGNLDLVIKVESKDEIAELAEVLNWMALQLKIEIVELQQASEKLRRLNLELEEKVRERTKELEEANIRLQEASAHKSEFLANMSHELRTPLNSIIGFTTLLLEGVDGPVNEEQRKSLEKVLRNSEHLLALINSVLDLSKIEAGKMELRTTRFPIKEVLDTVCGAMEPIAQKKGLRLKVDVEGVDTIYGDKAKIKQVIMNLVSNAIKFSNRGTIRVSVKSEGQDVVITVRDQGIGIPEEELTNIFEPFHQIDGSSTRGYQGTGLGLSIAKRFVEMHGGRIWVESVVGEGSAFTFTIPQGENDGKDFDRG